MKIAIVVSEFNKNITQQMLDSALLTAKKENMQVLQVARVPGALEIPLTVKKLLKKKQIEGVATLGAVIQGDTEHDRVVAFTCAQKLVDLSLEFEKPVTLGVSGPRMTEKQALSRAKEYGQRCIETLKQLKQTLKNLD